MMTANPLAIASEILKKAQEGKNMSPEERQRMQRELIESLSQRGFKALSQEEIWRINANEKGDHADNPLWLYTHWNWSAWTLEAQQYWIKKWKETHPSNFVSLYQLLRDNQGDWYYINNFLSNHNDTGAYSYTNIPNPQSAVAKLEPERIRHFYEDLVPYAGAFVIWFRQMNHSLINNLDLTTIKWKINTTSPGIWFEMKKDDTVDAGKAVLKEGKKIAKEGLKQVGDLGADLEKPILYGGAIFGIGILALGAIALSK